MAETWTTVKASDVQPGDVVRLGDAEFEVARVESPFFGIDTMVALIEDNPNRWHKYPAGADMELEVRRTS
jgi:hypothetical protein